MTERSGDDFRSLILPAARGRRAGDTAMTRLTAAAHESARGRDRAGTDRGKDGASEGAPGSTGGSGPDHRGFEESEGGGNR